MSLWPADGWSLRRGDRTLRSDDCAGVWWRRPETPLSVIAGPSRDAIRDQWRALAIGLAVVDGPTWVSNPGRISAAEDKSHQLRAAGAAGLLVPETLWTNDIEEALAFVEHWARGAVAKSIATAWWEVAGRAHFVYASLVDAGDLPTSERLAQAPVCFQQPISPKRDIRVTVVGDAVFAAERAVAGSERNEPLDWRRATEAPWSRYVLPDEIARSCRALVETFGLRFSGIDLAVDTDGRHWFLELNPNGEWGWLQRAGLPIAQALADVLLSRQA